MNPRIVTFLLAAAMVVCVGVVTLLAKRRDRAQSAGSGLPEWNLSHLLLASFLTLFAELAFIRWIAVEVRVFAYFKNLALLLCFMGFGIGCALARNPIRWLTSATAFVGLLLLAGPIRRPWKVYRRAWELPPTSTSG